MYLTDKHYINLYKIITGDTSIDCEIDDYTIKSKILGMMTDILVKELKKFGL